MKYIETWQSQKNLQQEICIYVLFDCLFECQSNDLFSLFSYTLVVKLKTEFLKRYVKTILLENNYNGKYMA